MLTEMRNTRIQGNVGLGIAIGYFCTCGYNVSVPLTDSQEYDLVVEIDGQLKKVQVKTTWYQTEYGIYQVMLKTCGGNKSSNKIKNFNPSIVDLLFVLTNDGTRYLIPTWNEMPKTSINFGKEYDKFKV